MLYIEVSGCLPMCGHGTIGVATVLVETGMVEVAEPVTTIRLDTPAGLVVAEVRVEDGAATEVTITNVPSFSAGLDRVVKVPGVGEVVYDLAYGGNYYAILPVESVGLPFERSHKQAILDAGLAIMGGDQRAGRAGPSAGPRHPGLPPRAVHRARLRRPALAARDGDPSRLVRPLAVRHRYQRPDGPSCTPGGSCRWTPPS
ncbi:hypothetical protein GCM10018952_43510 [Streptosporangium vulgare]